MKAIKKSFCFLFAVLAAAFTAHAVDPVAVWSGDFDTTTKGKYTINANGNTVAADGSYITITSSNGVLIDWTDRSDFSGNGYITVIVKYSNWTAIANNGALATLWAGGNGSNNKDIVGPFTTASSGVLGNIWNGATDSRGTTQNKALPATGVFSFDYSGNTAPKGSVAYIRDGSGNFVEACSGNGSLFTSSQDFYGLAIGGSRNAQSNLKAQTNMKIEAIAIFNTRLTTAQLADYTFPEPEVLTEPIVLFESTTQLNYNAKTRISTDTSITMDQLRASAFGGTIGGEWMPAGGIEARCVLIDEVASTADKLVVQIQVYDDREATRYIKFVNLELTVESDGVYAKNVHRAYLTVNNDSGIGTLQTGGTSNDGEAANVYAIVAFSATWMKPVVQGDPSIISINIANANSSDVTAEVETLAGTIPAAGWITVGYPANNGERKGSTSTVKYAKGEECGTVSGASFTWTSAGTSFQNMISGISSSIPFMKDAYCRGSGAVLEGATLTLAGIPYKSYDAIVYISGKTSTANKSITVNGTAYYGGSIDDAHRYGTYEGSSASWGQPTSPAKDLSYGVNAIRVEGQTEANLVVGLPNPFGGNWGVAAIQVVENVGTPVVKNPSKAEIDDDATWGDLGWDTLPTASDKAELTVSAKSTLTLDDTTAFKSLKLIGSSDLTIAGLDSANIGLVSKINTSSFTGKLRFEIDASAGFTADDTLRNFIRTASDKMTFVFKSTVANKGVTINYGTSVNATLNTHLVFDGGTHTFKYGQGSQSIDFGRGATSTNPTLYVKSGTTLNVHGKDMSGWTGSYNANAIIRVDDGGVANLCYNDGTFFYRHQLYLMPGAKVDIQTDQFFLQGGKAGNQIYVPESNSTKPAVITGTIALHPDQNREFGIYVGKGSALKIAKVGTNTNANNKNVVKYGEGTLIATDTVNLNTFEISLGTFGVEGAVSLSALTLNSSAMLDINSGAPIVTGSLSTPASKQLNLTITEPTHMMPVITLPAGSDMTGWTAVVNGNTANPCELVTDGNTLKLKWKIPPTITVEADDVMIETADDWNGGVVTIGLGGLTVGDYEDDIRYLIKFGDKLVTGSAANGVATFELSADEFTAGNIYRGTFELEYGTGNAPIAAAEVTVYAGEKTYGMKEGWINETTSAFKSTGVYDPAQGAEVTGDFIKFANPTDVVFTPTNSPADYVAKCDSEVTFEIFSGEEAIPDDDDTVADDLQAGVKIVDDGSGGVKFQFISGDAWIDGPAATLNATYSVTVNFHYAKEEGDTDSVTYTVGETVLPCARRANVAERLETISFADGTKIASLVGTCQIEVADPVTQGMEPGAAEKELKATDEAAAQAEASKIPVVVPSVVEGGLTDGLDDEAAAKAKADYKAWFQVVAKQGEDGKWVASVVPTAAAEANAVAEAQKVSANVLAEVTALTGDKTEGAATVKDAVPGFFYGVAENGEVVNMKTAEPDEWKMAGASGEVELKVTKPANAKARFYKVLCSPLPKTSK